MAAIVRWKNTVLILITIAALSLSGCGLWTHITHMWEKPDRTKGTAEQLYQKGYDAYQAGWYKRSIEYFQKVRDQYPLSKLALLAELGIADAHFSDEDYGEAELAYNDFVSLHPTNENVAYVTYQLGMCHYKQMYSIDRDQAETSKAQKEFEKLIARFPNSKFSLMAEKTLRECKKNLAEHEFYVGYFYFKKKQYKSAMKRFETIAKDYANLGLDYKVSYFLGETKKRIALEEASKIEAKSTK